MSDWLSPMNKLTFIKAIKARAKQVKIDDGRKFNITYQGTEVLIKPERGFLPMGRFELDHVTSTEWFDG